MPTLNSTVKAARIRKDDIEKLEKMLSDGNMTFSMWVSMKIRENKYTLDMPYHLGRDLESLIMFGGGTPKEFFMDLYTRLDNGELEIRDGKLEKPA